MRHFLHAHGRTSARVLTRRACAVCAQAVAADVLAQEAIAKEVTDFMANIGSVRVRRAPLATSTH